jgi:hypothetical protein
MHRELKARDNQADGNANKGNSLVLLPLEVMVRPLELRFHYHFEGDRPTNRLDKVRLVSQLWKFTLKLTIIAGILPFTRYRITEHSRRIFCDPYAANSPASFSEIEPGTHFYIHRLYFCFRHFFTANASS